MRQFSWIVCGCLALASLWAGSDATAADAEIGVSGKIIVVGPDGVKKELDFGKADKDCNAKGCNIQVRINDGKVTIIGPEGKKQEFNIDEKEGVRFGHIMGKAIIIGPDGKPKEIDLGGKLGNLDLDQLLGNSWKRPSKGTPNTSARCSKATKPLVA